MSDSSQFIFNQGSLLTQSATVSNGAPFVVGDGTNPALYEVYPNGTNSFLRGLRIAPNATLCGYGYIAAMVTNSGVIAPGLADFLVSSVLGSIEISGGLVLSNSSDLQFQIGGYDPDTEIDFMKITGNTVLAGKLSVSLTNDFPSMMTNGASFTILTNSTILTGTFTNVASGGVLTTTDGYARFTVLYAGARTVRLTNLQIVDSDGDGMPDWWEDAHGLDKNVPDATSDLDGDGASNIDELRAGTDPNDSDSVFRVAIQRETNNLRITWTAIGGKSYRVQTNAPTATGGISANFADVSPLISVGGTGESTTNYLHMGGATNAPAGYYRVRLAP